MSLPIPEWAPDLQAPGWANIHDILPAPARLSGVDALCGDLNAHTLVLGKDYAPARVLRERIAEGNCDPYRYDAKLPTNRMLCAMLAEAGHPVALDGSTAETCGIYYANAYYLLRDDGRWSGALPNAKAARAQSMRMVQYIIKSLPRLKRIIALGADAYSVLTDLFELEGQWRANLEARRALTAYGVTIHASSHLGSRGLMMRVLGAARAESIEAIKEDWRQAFQA